MDPVTLIKIPFIQEKQFIKEESLFYEAALQKEIDEDRSLHGKKPLKNKDDNDDNSPSDSSGEKEVKASKTDPESGWFHKGEHKRVFAYAIETACDKNGWILGYTVHPGNQHDSRTFPAIYEKLKKFDIETLVMDSGYKTPAIAKTVIDDGKTPLFPYKRPMTKEGFFRKHEYASHPYAIKHIKFLALFSFLLPTIRRQIKEQLFHLLR